ncbi:polysaccharide deacetylase [Methylobacterium currus]|uniref:Chitooligosaccharide deacetylase n=1 Tax=Methylobacterium currus TaxID=2051553 RepID=A0A2R4WMD2_9HYPH|nr:polysaccharide deacetylase [Methylobacterium currus]AWB22707.1 polysaccharide deacetylase [Methylobacterium currus]UHC17695.1 polysaccharide deacetylase [Methylobacterium currus]
MNRAALDSIPLTPANLAPPAPDYPWPAPYRSAMFLSFDVDAESAWTSKDASHAERLVTMSYGAYEARVGTPKLLELLDQLGLKGTFFITGWAVDAYPAMAEAIVRGGHEIGHHGYHHLMPDPGAPFMEEEIERGFETLKRRLGVVPTGYRAPYGEFTDELRRTLVKHGIVYTSSFRDDVRPYRHVLRDRTPGPIELPVTASYDDWMHGLSTRFSPRSIFPKEHVLSLWKDELDEVRDWGAMVTTVLHPQCSGRPMRLRLLREFLTYAQGCPDLWITTGEAIAENFLNHERAA